MRKEKESKGDQLSHISSHKMKGDRIPCGGYRERHSPPALLDRRRHILLTQSRGAQGSLLQKVTMPDSS